MPPKRGQSQTKTKTKTKTKPNEHAERSKSRTNVKDSKMKTKSTATAKNEPSASAAAPAVERSRRGGKTEADLEPEEIEQVSAAPLPMESLVYLLETASAFGLEGALAGLSTDLGEQADAVLQSEISKERDLPTRLTICGAFNIMKNSAAYDELPTAIAAIEQHVEVDAVEGLADLLDVCRVQHVLYYCSPPLLDMIEDAIEIVFPSDAHADLRDQCLHLLQALKDKKPNTAKAAGERLHKTFPKSELPLLADEVYEKLSNTMFEPLPLPYSERAAPSAPTYSTKAPAGGVPQYQPFPQPQAFAQVHPSNIQMPDAAALLRVVGGGAQAAAAGLMAQNPLSSSAAATAAAVQQMVQPSPMATALAGGVPLQRTILRSGVRSRHRWTPAEDEALLEGLCRYGWGSWAAIRNGYSDVFDTYERQSHDLKDRFRNMQKKDAAGTTAALDAAQQRYTRKVAAKQRGRAEARTQLQIEEEENIAAQEVAKERQRQALKRAGALVESEDDFGIPPKAKKRRPSRSGAAQVQKKVAVKKQKTQPKRSARR